MNELTEEEVENLMLKFSYEVRSSLREERKRGRALRRHHRARVIRNRIRQIKDLSDSWSGYMPSWLDSGQVGMLAHTSLYRICSCELCRFGKQQENRRFRRDKSWLNEW